MQAQEASTFIFFKLWPWVEANIKRIGISIGIAAVVAVLVSFYFWQQNQKEIAAGQALTQLIVATPPNVSASELADSYLQIANTHGDTRAAQRALLRGATELFAAGRYAEAQTEFQKFLDAHPDSQFSGQAALGVAASLEAQGKMDLAADAYQKVVNGFTDPLAADNAKFALGRIYEAQGKTSDARNFYEEVARANPNNSLGSEAALRAMELKTKLSSTSSSAVPSTSFNLSH
ncbi:MAG TPA: tetratricopeptide repeat protein [Verrucomicrobiae bacterium]|jgi:TolA-binding protein